MTLKEIGIRLPPDMLVRIFDAEDPEALIEETTTGSIKQSEDNFYLLSVVKAWSICGTCAEVTI